AEQDPEPETTTEPEPEPEPEPVAEEKPQPAAQATTETKPEAEEKPQPETTTEHAPEAEPTAEERPQGAKPEGEAAAEVTTATTETTGTTEPEAAAEPEPAVEVEPEVTPEPEAAEPEAEAPAEVTSEAEQAEPTATDPEPAVEPEPKPEAVAETTPEPVAETAPEPSPEPEAAKEPEPVAAAPEPVAAADGAAEAPVDADGAADAKPALSLARVRSRAPGLVTAYKAAATALDKHGLTGTRAKVYLVLDRSASMRPYYKDGSAQALGEQVLALAAHLDPEATVHVVFFSTELDGTGELTLAEYENKIDDLHAGLGRMGRTSYHAAVEAVTSHHDKSADPALPALVVFQTDGAPDAKTPATQSLADATKSHPALFFSFIAFGDPENKAFDYLRKLKTDNTAHFLAGETPRELTDTEVYEGVLANWRP
ncbi:VWA domain-containing protein, partial [Streptomyces sp. NPDC046931]|uniref:VWA domain-containing protein n=1 Tax=Streptomyces sp. NPDC046931 TaxID=3154806 RepID=UPI0034020592